MCLVNTRHIYYVKMKKEEKVNGHMKRDSSQLECDNNTEKDKMVGLKKCRICNVECIKKEMYSHLFETKQKDIDYKLCVYRL